MLKILIIEDEKDIRSSFLDYIDAHKAKIKSLSDIRLFEAKDFAEGKDKLENEDVQAIIIDNKLASSLPDDNEERKAVDDNEYKGAEVLEYLIQKNKYIVCFYTGTPGQISDTKGIKVFVKSSHEPKDVLQYIMNIHSGSFSKMLLKKGKLDEILNNIFWDKLYKESEFIQKLNSEEIIGRRILEYISEEYKNRMIPYLPEETYIISFIVSSGSIIKHRKDKKNYVIITPVCDMVFREEKVPEFIHVCEILSNNVIVDISQEISNKTKRLKKINEIIKNNYSKYYYWLPEVENFHGGIIDFRTTKSYNNYQQFINDYEILGLKIVKDFMVNIYEVYSSYYSRQGQPDYNFNVEAEKIYKQLFEDHV